MTPVNCTKFQIDTIKTPSLFRYILKKRRSFFQDSLIIKQADKENGGVFSTPSLANPRPVTVFLPKLSSHHFNITCYILRKCSFFFLSMQAIIVDFIIKLISFAPLTVQQRFYDTTSSITDEAKPSLYTYLIGDQIHIQSISAVTATAISIGSTSLKVFVSISPLVQLP